MAEIAHRPIVWEIESVEHRRLVRRQIEAEKFKAKLIKRLFQPRQIEPMFSLMEEQIATAAQIIEITIVRQRSERGVFWLLQHDAPKISDIGVIDLETERLNPSAAGHDAAPAEFGIKRNAHGALRREVIDERLPTSERIGHVMQHAAAFNIGELTTEPTDLK